MYNFRPILFCLSLIPLFASANDSSSRKPDISYRNSVLFSVNYSRQFPIGELKDRFGNSNSLGASVSYKFGRNWQVQGGINTMFGGQVKENGLFDTMIGGSGYMLNVNGSLTIVKLYERGYNFHFDIGKIIALGNFDKNSGLLISGGLGFMEHRIRINYEKTVVPQLEGDYYKGYDRLSNGLMLRGYAGYQRIDPKGAFSFSLGIEVLNGYTKNRRSYNYDTRMADTHLRNDLLLGLRASVMVTLSGRQAGKKKGEEERYFE